MLKFPNIIQRRELEPLLLKALKIIKHYEKASDCAVIVMNADEETNFIPLCSFCKHKQKTRETGCCQIHKNSINDARRYGGSYIYICPEKMIFWTSPFYAGERFAGALISGGLTGTVKNNTRVKALANILLIYAEQISSMSYVQKNITTQLKLNKHENIIEETETINNENKNNENNACLIDMERILLASLRRGDNIDARKKLFLLMETQYREVRCNLPAFRLKALELAVLLSRAAWDHYGINSETILETNNRYMKKLEESQDFKEITEILLHYTENISEKIFSYQGVRHFSAIRKAERFIWENYTRKLSLQEIAGVSGLSAPYFSTIFKEEMGENLSNYLNRLRVEKAATILITTNIPISEIARICGFEDQSWFSKIFKNNTGLTPGKYRDQGSISGISA